MKVLVAYYSETGNTEKVARAVCEEVSKDHETHMEKIEDVTADELKNYDLVFFGSACHSSDLAAPVKRILNSIPSSPKFKLAGFFTHATSQEGFKRWASKCILSFQEASKEKRIDFKGYFNCQGAPSTPIQDFIKRDVITSPEEWKKYIKEVMRHPTTEDLHKAREFARKVISQA